MWHSEKMVIMLKYRSSSSTPVLSAIVETFDFETKKRSCLSFNIDIPKLIKAAGEVIVALTSDSDLMVKFATHFTQINDKKLIPEQRYDYQTTMIGRLNTLLQDPNSVYTQIWRKTTSNSCSGFGWTLFWVFISYFLEYAFDMYHKAYNDVLKSKTYKDLKEKRDELIQKKSNRKLQNLASYIGQKNYIGMDKISTIMHSVQISFSPEELEKLNRVIAPKGENIVKANEFMKRFKTFWKEDDSIFREVQYETRDEFLKFDNIWKIRALDNIKKFVVKEEHFRHECFRDFYAENETNVLQDEPLTNKKKKKKSKKKSGETSANDERQHTEDLADEAADDELRQHIEKLRLADEAAKLKAAKLKHDLMMEKLEQDVQSLTAQENQRKNVLVKRIKQRDVQVQQLLSKLQRKVLNNYPGTTPWIRTKIIPFDAIQVSKKENADLTMSNYAIESGSAWVPSPSLSLVCYIPYGSFYYADEPGDLDVFCTGRFENCVHIYSKIDPDFKHIKENKFRDTVVLRLKFIMVGYGVKYQMPSHCLK